MGKFSVAISTRFELEVEAANEDAARHAIEGYDEKWLIRQVQNALDVEVEIEESDEIGTLAS
jgi:hypothetical protein